MKKKRQTLQKPRYIVIKIQYYPIPRSVLVILFLFVILFASSFVSKFLEKESRVMNYESREKYNKTVIHDSSFMIQEVLGLNKLQKKDESIIFHGDRTKKEIALTFDADMTPGMKRELENGYVSSYYNKAVIDILNKTQTKATLFLSGMWIEIYLEDAKKLAKNPLFELASHSYSHPSFAGECYGLGEIPDNQDYFQIEKTQQLLKQLTGFENRYFRFPGGCYSENDLKITKELGVLAIQWDSVGDDGFNFDPESITHNVLNSAQNGSIIVLHMHGGPIVPMTAVALPEIITTLKQRGFTFVTLSELLNGGSCPGLLPDVLVLGDPLRWDQRTARDREPFRPCHPFVSSMY